MEQHEAPASVKYGTLYHTERLGYMTEKAKDWAQLHGLCVRIKEKMHESDVVQIAPFSLFPSSVPKALYDQALGLQEDMVSLYHKIEFDYEFLCASLGNVVKTDDFTGRLLDIYKQVYNVNSDLMSQPLVLTIQRPDYMFHQPPDAVDTAPSLKQVEVNQISSAAAGLGTTVNRLHKHIMLESGYEMTTIDAHLPDNPAMQTVGSGLAEAWRAYGDPNAYCLFIVEDGNRNVFDQRMMEYEFIRQTIHRGHVLRMTLTQAADQLWLDEGRGFRLCTKDGNKKVSVVYFRAGYVPEHYHSEAEWKVRLIMERSNAIKCPWVGAQLAGTKKVQQLLARPDILRRFITSDEIVDKISATFVGLYGFDDYHVLHQLGSNGVSKFQAELDDVLTSLHQNPQQFVLKPQLEGGGNNVYGDDILDVLNKMNAEEREAYILMDRIFPMKHNNYLVRANEKCQLSPVVSEFGTFGYVLGSKDHILKSHNGGYLMRTKLASVNEGGLMSGNGAVDSAYLHE